MDFGGDWEVFRVLRDDECPDILRPRKPGFHAASWVDRAFKVGLKPTCLYSWIGSRGKGWQPYECISQSYVQIADHDESRRLAVELNNCDRDQRDANWRELAAYLIDVGRVVRHEERRA